MIDKKYRCPPQSPLIFNATVEYIQIGTKKICDQTKALLDKLVTSVKLEDATFDNVLIPIVENEDECQALGYFLGIHQKVSTDSSIREASADAENTRSHFQIDCDMREDVFGLIDAVFHKNEDLDSESRKLLVEERRKYVRNGLLLSLQSDRDRLNEIRKRLTSLGTEFAVNLDQGGLGMWFTREELDGMPPDVVGVLEQGTGENEEKFKVTFKDADFGPLMQFVHSGETRRLATLQNANQGTKNIPLCTEAVKLRYEAARILGYPTHAAYKLEVKMAKTPETVTAFLEEIRQRVYPHIGKVVEKMRNFKKDYLASRDGGQDIDTEFYSWDMSYYGRLRTEKEYSIDRSKVAEYFPLHPTVNAMLSLFGNLFGFTFIEIKEPSDRAALSSTGEAADLVWHEDVILYSVWDSSSPESSPTEPFIGYLYLDLHPRPGKYGHAECYPLQLGYRRPNGQVLYPCTVLITNFTKPTPTKPSLLQHSEIEMLFHELGHGMHDLSGRSRYSRFFGASNVGDFNEEPSQMLENWCWDARGLRVLSGHYETGEPMPEQMINALLRTRYSSVPLKIWSQLRMCLFDMRLHAVPLTDKMDIGEIYLEYENILGLKGLDRSLTKYGYAKWRHLFGSGYDAGLYDYFWSNVAAMDMFDTTFRQDPMDGEAGKRYRHMVLSKGGSQDEVKTLVDFLGREPKPDAFFKGLGLD